ncbi:MAG: hypothetical protein JSW23_09605 [Planctomycetota bacterium]|nr:MAG: hypothetical protein JSW23_09605 [Planctomycetota bacterium]
MWRREDIAVSVYYKWSKCFLEAGIVTDEKEMVGKIAERFDSIWRGCHCRGCKRKEYCADYKDILA